MLCSIDVNLPQLCTGCTYLETRVKPSKLVTSKWIENDRLGFVSVQASPRYSLANLAHGVGDTCKERHAHIWCNKTDTPKGLIEPCQQRKSKSHRLPFLWAGRILCDPDTLSTDLGVSQPVAIDRLVKYDLCHSEIPIQAERAVFVEVCGGDGEGEGFLVI